MAVATFQTLHSHTGLVATKLDSTERFHHHRKSHWTGTPKDAPRLQTWTWCSSASLACFSPATCSRWPPLTLCQESPSPLYPMHSAPLHEPPCPFTSLPVQSRVARHRGSLPQGPYLCYLKKINEKHKALKTWALSSLWPSHQSSSPPLLHLREHVISALPKLLIKMYSYVIHLHLVLFFFFLNHLNSHSEDCWVGKGKSASTSNGASHNKHTWKMGPVYMSEHKCRKVRKAPQKPSNSFSINA